MTCRALGEFAAEAGIPQDKASQLVNSFLASLQALDNTLISSLRSKSPVPDTADKQLNQTIQDLDRCETCLHISEVTVTSRVCCSELLMPACWDKVLI